MSMNKIIVAGSILVDHINAIDAYPSAGELTQIRSVTKVPGGLVPNTGRDIRLLSPDIPVWAFGSVGDDADGRFVSGELEKAGMTLRLAVEKTSTTSFTEVMSVTGGERTFFTYPGASAEWGYEKFPFDDIQAGDLVLLGYFLLLPRIDNGDGLKILKELKRRGAKTAIDLVTENSDRYGRVRECLPFVDYLIVNETEAARIVGKELPFEDLCTELLALGVNERVVIHAPERGVTCARGGAPVSEPSCKLPADFIKGKTGAGDAYCAGALVAIWKGFAERDILRTGAVAAVGALSAPGATDGVKSLAELQEMVAGF